MCTIGAYRFSSGNEFFVFKNKDFGKPFFDDRLYIDDDVFAVLGCANWEGCAMEHYLYSGYSLASNKHLVCCDANIETVEGAENHDILVQAIIENCQSLDEVQPLLGSLLSEKRYSSVNLLVASKEGMVAYELVGHSIKAFYAQNFIVRTNHAAGCESFQGRLMSYERYNRALSNLEKLTNLTQVFDLLSAVNPENYCYYTVYSYVIHCKAEDIDLYVCKGAPSGKNSYIKIPIGIDKEKIKKCYP